MALKEQDIVLTAQDAQGNTVIQMPITRIENVEGGVKSVNGTAADTNGNVTLTKADITDSLGYTPLQTAPVTSVNGKTGAVTLSIPATPKAYVTATYVSGNIGYRKWSDGFIEQWNTRVYIARDSSATWTLPHAMTTTNYNVTVAKDDEGDGGKIDTITRNTSSLYIKVYSWPAYYDIKICGY